MSAGILVERLFEKFFSERFLKVSVERAAEIPLRVLIEQCIDFFAKEQMSGIHFSWMEVKAYLESQIPGFLETLKKQSRLLIIEMSDVKERSIFMGGHTLYFGDQNTALKALFLVQLLFEDLREISLQKLSFGPGFSFMISQADADKMSEIQNETHVVKSLLGPMAEDIAINFADPLQKRNPLRADGMLGTIATSNYALPEFFVVPFSAVKGRAIEILYVSGDKTAHTVTDEDMVVIGAAHKKGMTLSSEAEKARYTKPQSLMVRTEAQKAKLFHDRPGITDKEPNCVGVLFEASDVVATQYKIYMGSTFDRPDAFFDLEKAKAYCNTVVREKRSFGSWDAFIAGINAVSPRADRATPYNELLGRASWDISRSAILAYNDTENAKLQAMAIQAIMQNTLREKYESTGGLPFWFEHVNIPILIETEGAYQPFSTEKQAELKETVSSYTDAEIQDRLKKSEYGFLYFLSAERLSSLTMAEGTPVMIHLIKSGYQGKAMILLAKMGQEPATYVQAWIGEGVKRRDELQGVLVAACRQNQLKLAEVLLANGVMITKFCLMQALRKNHLDMLQLLISKPALFDEESSHFLYQERAKVRIHLEVKPEDESLQKLSVLLGTFVQPVGVSELSDAMADDAHDAAPAGPGSEVGGGSSTDVYRLPVGVKTADWRRVEAIVKKMVLFEMTYPTCFTSEQREACSYFLLLKESSGPVVQKSVESWWPMIMGELVKESFDVEGLIEEAKKKTTEERGIREIDLRKDTHKKIYELFKNTEKVLSFVPLKGWCSKEQAKDAIEAIKNFHFFLESKKFVLKFSVGSPMHKFLNEFPRDALEKIIRQLKQNFGDDWRCLSIIQKIQNGLKIQNSPNYHSHLFWQNLSLQWGVTKERQVYQEVQSFLDNISLGGVSLFPPGRVKEIKNVLFAPGFALQVHLREKHLQDLSDFYLIHGIISYKYKDINKETLENVFERKKEVPVAFFQEIFFAIVKLAKPPTFDELKEMVDFMMGQLEERGTAYIEKVLRQKFFCDEGLADTSPLSMLDMLIKPKNPLTATQKRLLKYIFDIYKGYEVPASSGCRVSEQNGKMYHFEGSAFACVGVNPDNDCGFSALGISRRQYVEFVLPHVHLPKIKEALALEIQTEALGGHFTESMAKESGLSLVLIEAYKLAVKEERVEEADTMAQKLLDSCRSDRACYWYVSHLSEPMQWLGHYSLTCYAMLMDIELRIYSTNASGDLSVLQEYRPSKSRRKLDIIWTAQAGGHYDLLLDPLPPEFSPVAVAGAGAAATLPRRNSKKRLLGGDEGVAVSSPSGGGGGRPEVSPSLMPFKKAQEAAAGGSGRGNKRQNNGSVPEPAATS